MCFLRMKYFVFLVFLQFVRCSPEKKISGPPPSKVLDFMKSYGYLKKDKNTSAALYTEEGLTDALKTVQRFGAIEETGKLDNATLKLMASPRCGNPDVVHGKRSKRFTFGSEGWNKRHITYYVANWSARLGEEKVARLIGKALDTWGSYGGLKFSRKTTPDADIIVSFARGAHNDPFPFDGPGFVLAHAYFPNEGSEFSGDIHFDDDEEWVESGPQEILTRGTDFYTVALHELGHSLGLGHSDDPNSIMFPYYRGDDESALQLGQDDILAMYQLYIVRPVKETTTTTTENSPPRRTRPVHTRPPYDPRRTETSTTYYTSPPSTFYPSTRSRYTERTTRYTTPIYRYPDSDKYPSRNTERTTLYTDSSSRDFGSKEYPYSDRTTIFTSSRFPYTTSTEYYTRTKEYSDPRVSGTVNRHHDYSSSNLPTTTRTSTPPPIPSICEGNFDTVANLRGELFVFKDKYIWRLQERNRIMQGYPILLSQMFPNLPEDITKIDAAYQRPDGNMIFFTGDNYWVYDGTIFTENSPRYILDYGIPSNIGGIDAVQQWEKNGKTYLFKGDRFWRYNETNKSVDPGYPVHIERWRGGLPKDLDAALTWKDGITYFIKGDQYWILDNKSVIVHKAPRSFSKDWLGC